jgi:hypothetical protein
MRFFVRTFAELKKAYVGLGAHVLYRVASKSYNEYGDAQTENLFTPISMASTASIYTKPTITQQSFIDIRVYTEVYTNLTKNVECTGKIPFAPLNCIWLSLHRFLRNS